MPIAWNVPDQGSRSGRRCLAARRRDSDGALCAPRHLERSATRKGEQQHTFGWYAREQQVRHPVRKRAGFAGAGAGNDEQGAGADAGAGLRLAVPYCVTLRGIEGLEIASCEHRAAL